MEREKFELTNAPLALVLGQVAFSYAPEFAEAGEKLRMPLKEIGLPVAEPRDQISMSVQLSESGANPRQSVARFWSFSDPQRTKSVLCCPKYVAFVVNEYKSFDAYLNWVEHIVDVVDSVFPEVYFYNVGLRYFNIFKPEQSRSEWLCESVRGVTSEGIDTEHIHHNYTFWCTTKTGNLQAICSLQHGGKVQRPLEFVTPMVPKELLFSEKDHVYHLDIFENSSALDPQLLLNKENVGKFFRTQHDNIDQLFVNLLSEKGKERFGWQLRS